MCVYCIVLLLLWCISWISTSWLFCQRICVSINENVCSMSCVDVFPWNSPISACTRQHLVDTEHVEWMYSNPHVELILSRVLHHVLVGTDTAGFHGLARDLFNLVRHKMDTERKFRAWCLLPSQVKDPNLGVCIKQTLYTVADRLTKWDRQRQCHTWHTTAETGLGVGLVLAVAVAKHHNITKEKRRRNETRLRSGQDHKEKRNRVTTFLMCKLYLPPRWATTHFYSWKSAAQDKDRLTSTTNITTKQVPGRKFWKGWHTSWSPSHNTRGREEGQGWRMPTYNQNGVPAPNRPIAWCIWSRWQVRPSRRDRVGADCARIVPGSRPPRSAAETWGADMDW